MTIEQAPPVALDAVEWRVDGKPSDNNTARFVPYVDAATTARLLDEWVGPDGWKDAYEPADLNGKPALWCFLSIRDGDEWVTKCDVGVPSNFEGQKGMVSDAFKRAACLKWGVARNVYELPTMWAPCRVDNKGNAWPNDQTIPTILRKLSEAGYEATGAKEATAVHDLVEQQVEAEKRASKDDIDAIKALTSRLTDEQRTEYVDGHTVCGVTLVADGRIKVTPEQAAGVKTALEEVLSKGALLRGLGLPL